MMLKTCRRKILAVIYATLAVASEKNSGLNGIRTHDLCDAGVVLYQLSYQANWGLSYCEHCTGIAEVMGSNPVQAWIFFRLSFRNC